MDKWLQFGKDFYNLLYPGIDNRFVLSTMHKWSLCMKEHFAGAITPEDFQILLLEGLKFMVWAQASTHACCLLFAYAGDAGWRC